MRVVLTGICCLLVLLEGLGCKPATSLPPNQLPGVTLILVEDLDGKGGLGDGSFGDVVMYDPMSGDKYILTSDSFYDTHPSCPTPEEKIYFESKRSGKSPIFDLSTPSHIYTLDLEDEAIRPWDIPLQEKFGQMGSESYLPAVSPDGSKIAFAAYQDAGRWQIAIYDEEAEMLEIVADSLNRVVRLQWSETGQFLAIAGITFGQSFGDVEIITIDLHNQKTEVISRDNWTHGLGGFNGDKLTFYGYEIKVGSDEILYEIDLTTGERQELYRMRRSHDGWFSSPTQVTDDNMVYLLCSDKPETSGLNVCKLNIDTKDLELLTEDYHIRSGMLLCR